MRPLHPAALAALLVGLSACAQNGTQIGSVPTDHPGAADRAKAPLSIDDSLLSRAGIYVRPGFHPSAAGRRGGWLSPAATQKNAHLVYVSSPNGNIVDVFPEYAKNVAPIGQITNGIDEPTGMAVDSSGNLFVANVNNNTVTVYPPGNTNPSVTYSTGLQFPIDVAVGNDGTVYVSCFFGGFVVEYPPGSTNPSLTITPPPGGLPFGIVIDPNNNLDIVYTTGVIYQYPPGSATGTSLGIQLPCCNPHGLAIDTSGDLLVAVSNAPGPGSAIYVYPPGATTPSQTITAGLGQPFMLAFNRIGHRLFAADFGINGNGDGSVLEYRFPGGAVLTPVTQGVATAAYGVAITPPQPL